ncbi:DUF2156 domain-containing protein [Candidatus Saccharibacteria bacterium]|jgi:phosphatidylglycerol lysyltransferase|nr:DUF2156 domain-containing protein [Candidatus Saccharibacteria bacterium]MBP7834585.1 DUF2156 domain-containing protein [Candidatus Saccharibacteria bacterium]
MLKNITFENILNVVKKIPGTIILVVSILAVSILTKSMWHSAEKFGLVSQYGFGLPSFQEGRWWTIFTGAAISPEPWMLVIILVVVIAGCGYLEYFYGTLRMLAVILITHIGSILLTAGMLGVLDQLNIVWAVELAKVKDVGISNAGFGAVGAATAGLPMLWRRRARVIVFMYCLTFLLYSGLIWDISHFIAFMIGIALGPWVVGKSYKKSEFPLLNLEPRTLIAGIASLSIYSTIVTKLFPGNGGIVDFGNEVEYSSSFIASVVSVAFMSIFVYGLYKGKRFAWWAVLVLASLSFVGSLFLDNSGVKLFGLLFDATLIVLLIKDRKYFTIKSDSLIRKRLLIYGLAIFALIYVLHVSLVYSFKNTLNPVPSFSRVAIESAVQSVGQTSEYFKSNNKVVTTLINSIDIVWMVAFLALLAAVVVSTARDRSKRSGFEVFDRLMRQKGATNITWMARWPGMSYWVNKSETASFGYRLINNVAIILSDPVGSPQAIAASIESFNKYCTDKGWTVAYFSVSESFSKVLAKRGYKAIMVGEDTVIELDNLTFTGKEWQSVRSAINKAEKAGISMQTISYSTASLAIKDQLQAIANSWVADKSLPEMGFTLGTLVQAEDTEVIMNIAVDQDGTVHGMTSWMPVYRSGKIVGWTIDIMQRRLSDQTMGGVIEFLIAKSAVMFKGQGTEYISLSAAPLANSKTKKTSLEKLLTVLADKLEPFYGFKSLYRFKQKFQPVHKPLYLCYNDEAKLPAITAAIGKAYMNDTSYFKALTSMIKK